jgi:protein-S-isoprenylcysteine O-methyltransferase Ste14
MIPDPTSRLLIGALWLAWILYWWLSARNVKRTRWREPLKARLRHRVPLMLVALLMGAPRLLPPPLTRRFLPAGPALPMFGAVLVAAGLGFSIWARRHLGRNWSVSVVVKEDHTLVRSGPYARVRHPIYTGMLLALVGTVVAIGEWRGLVALGLALLAFAWKSRAEEERMRETFPEYEQYRRETASLIPFVY